MTDHQTDDRTDLDGVRRGDLVELAPLLRRTVDLDPAGLARLQRGEQRLRLLVRLPFDVLIARTITASPGEPSHSYDLTFGAAGLLAWIEDPDATEPTRRDAEWRSGSPPATGWQRVDTVPDPVVRDLVRSGALTLKQAAEREGVPGGQPRAEVSDALLSSVVLTVTGGPANLSAEVTLRALSALTRMGFLARDSHVAVDVAGRWTRIAAAYGSVFLERPGAGLGVLRL